MRVDLSRFGLATAVRLPLSFDEQLLRRDLSKILSEYQNFSPHHGPYHDGGWSAIGLVTLDGDERDQSQNRKGLYKQTPALRLAPYMQEVLNSIKCEKQRVRLLAMAPGSRIYEHHDRDESLDQGLARLHIPIITHPDVQVVLARQRQTWRPGELWYGDFSFPHHLWNRSSITRVHLVMDCEVNEFLCGLFPEGYVESRTLRGILRKALLTEFDWRRRLKARFSPN